MAKRLFVDGLPYTTTDTESKDLFTKVGDVASVSVIIDKFTGRSKGFAFVEIVKDENAIKAINELNETELGDRKIIVVEARPMEDGPRRDFGGGGRRDDRPRNGGFRGRSGRDRYSSGKRW